jgi:siroheme synthase (precorrin-2 oxidase/ferrochelatase)
MTTSTNQTDDIIELTEIVEEGISLDKKFEDFAMDKAVDAKSLDQELDDLLRDADTQSKPAAPAADDEIDLDILFEEPVVATAARPQPSTASAATQTPDQSMDISDLDDLFDSLGIGENEEHDTALDIILDGDTPEPRKHGSEPFYPSDSIDLELEIPGMENGDKNSNILDLTEDLLADIPETVLLESADKTMPEPVAAPEEPEATSSKQAPAQEYPAVDPAPALAEFAAEPAEASVAEPEGPAGDKPGQSFVEQKAPPADTDEPAPVYEEPDHAPSAPPATVTDIEPKQPRIAAEQTVTSEAGISIAELEIISARLDALESRPEPSPAPGAEELLGLLPQSPLELPVTRNLRQEIMEHLESRISELASSSSLDGLQESVSALQSQVEAIPDIRAELAKTPPLSALQKLEADLDEVRALIQPREELQPEQILALLPQSTQGWPVAQALRQEIIEHVESRVSELASSSSMDGLQESVNALQSQVEAIPDIRAELAKTLPASAMQKMEAELEELRTLVRNQEETVHALEAALSDKAAFIAKLSDNENRLREERDALAARVAAPGPDAIKSELHEYVRQQVPLAAAKVVREEIQALLKELGG